MIDFEDFELSAEKKDAAADAAVAAALAAQGLAPLAQPFSTLSRAERRNVLMMLPDGQVAVKARLLAEHVEKERIAKAFEATPGYSRGKSVHWADALKIIGE